MVRGGASGRVAPGALTSAVLADVVVHPSDLKLCCIDL